MVKQEWKFVMCPTRTTLVAFTMLRKGSELQKKDREVFLDLDYEGSMKRYGSLQTGSSSVAKSVSAFFNPSRFKINPWLKEMNHPL